MGVWAWAGLKADKGDRSSRGRSPDSKAFERETFNGETFNGETFNRADLRCAAIVIPKQVEQEEGAGSEVTAEVGLSTNELLNGLAQEFYVISAAVALSQHKQIPNLATKVLAKGFDRIGVHPTEFVIEQTINGCNPKAGICSQFVLGELWIFFSHQNS